MNIVAFSTGSFIALFPLEAFTPLGGLNERRTVDAMRERYSFISSPSMSSTREELNQTGIVFEEGIYDSAAGQVKINRLSVHDDGVVVRSNKTEHAEAFFNDFTSWLIEEYGCREIRKEHLYLSELVVDFGVPMSNVINNYNEITNLLLLHMDISREVKAAAFNALSIEFVTNNSMALAKFLIERRVGTTVEDERYFCSAPLTTKTSLRSAPSV